MAAGWTAALEGAGRWQSTAIEDYVWRGVFR